MLKKESAFMEQEVIISSYERTQPFVNEWLEEAIAYAVRMHRGAVRKGTVIPYIVHPLEVLNNLYLMTICLFLSTKSFCTTLFLLFFRLFLYYPHRVYRSFLGLIIITGTGDFFITVSSLGPNSMSSIP